MTFPINARSTMATTWSSLRPGLSTHSLNIIKNMSYSSPTLVQRETVPQFISNRDVAVEAVTGSGKTLCFVIPVVEYLLTCRQSWKGTKAVIITPTRELATQVSRVYSSFLPTELSVRLVIGGREIEDDIIAINHNGSVVVVATPGRLLDLLTHTNCLLASHVRSLEFLILDEADKLLEMGFQQSLNSILQYLPKQRRTGIFSATLNPNVTQLVKAGLRQPVIISVKEPGQASNTTSIPTNLHSYYLECEADKRLSILLALLTKLKDKKLIVFFATCSSVNYFSSLLSFLCPDLVLLSLHGRMHSKRQTIFNRFSAMQSGVLMCTDVVARGVDFPGVDWVIQFDPPSSSNCYVHRIGRTARMGHEGYALILLTPNEISYVEFLRLNKGLVLHSYSTLHSPCVREKARNIIAKERELYEAGIRAFVAFVRFYYKHECKLIFQTKSLDLLGHARGFALLHLPKMPELKDVDCSTFDPHPMFPRESMSRPQRSTRHAIPHKSVHQLKSKSVGQLRSKRMQKKRKHSQRMSKEDIEELARDARLLKKFKKGKISEAELDSQLQI